uniref:Uncharacterized protein n=1 Tax=Trypanosoma vivax (strain Y486) TaxID=1055687 RepID=G0TS35_TRYVY|nr:hypothetical protein TVY486_0201730 [Trypanosoma vivax Y486]
MVAFLHANETWCRREQLEGRAAYFTKCARHDALKMVTRSETLHVDKTVYYSEDKSNHSHATMWTHKTDLQYFQFCFSTKFVRVIFILVGCFLKKNENSHKLFRRKQRMPKLFSGGTMKTVASSSFLSGVCHLERLLGGSPGFKDTAYSTSAVCQGIWLGSA